MRPTIVLPTILFALISCWSVVQISADQAAVVAQLKTAEATLEKLSATIQEFLGAKTNVTDAAIHDEIISLGGKLWNRQVTLNQDMQSLGDFIGVPASGEDESTAQPKPAAGGRAR